MTRSECDDRFRLHIFLAHRQNEKQIQWELKSMLQINNTLWLGAYYKLDRRSSNMCPCLHTYVTYIPMEMYVCFCLQLLNKIYFQKTRENFPIEYNLRIKY